MAAKKLTIGGEIADTQYNLRTTQGIMNFLVEKAGQKDSINLLINKILHREKLKYDKQKQ